MKHPDIFYLNIIKYITFLCIYVHMHFFLFLVDILWVFVQSRFLIILYKSSTFLVIFSLNVLYIIKSGI